MVMPIVGAVLGAGGAGLSWYGTQRQEDAMQDAQGRYEGRLGDFYRGQQGMNREFTDRYRGVEDERNAAVSRTLGEFMAPGYGREAGDTATIDSTLSRARGAGGAPAAPRGGQAGRWAGAVQDRNSAAVGRTREVAADAGSVGRMALGQNKALGDFNIAETGLRRRVGDISQQEQLRRAQMQRELQELEQMSQLDYNHALGVGGDLRQIGGWMGAAGSLSGSMSAGQGRRPAGQTGQSPSWQGGTDPSNAPVGYDPYLR